MRLKAALMVLLLLSAAGSAGAQQRQPLGARIKPAAVDAVKRTGWATAMGTVLMAFGLGMDRLNRAQCGSNQICNGNAVQAGASFAFLGALLGATGGQYHSNCSRSARAIFGIVGAVVGVSAASAIGDVRLLNANRMDPATIRTMSYALL